LVIRNTNNECSTRHEHSGASCKHWKTSWIFQSLDGRVGVPGIRTINGGRVTYLQLQSYDSFAGVNQNYTYSVLLANNNEEWFVLFMETSRFL